MPPRRAHEAVDQHGAVHRAVAGEEHRAVLVGSEPGSVGVREQHVVVLGEEARRSGRVRIGAGRIGEIEELAAALVAERAELRAQPVEDLAHPGEA